jgi:hypothetical protein
MPVKGGHIEIVPTKGHCMGGTGRKNEPPKKPAKNPKQQDGSKKSPPALPEDDDIEDGDIATPKRDRNDEDDL